MNKCKQFELGVSIFAIGILLVLIWFHKGEWIGLFLGGNLIGLLLRENKF